MHRRQDFSRTVLPVEISVPLVKRYAAGTVCGPYYDQPFMPSPDGPQIRGDVSATLSLSDPAEYDGGELCLARVGAEECIKLRAGDLFLYSASTLHCLTAVTRGERLAVVFWIQSMTRDHDKRTLFVALDGLIGPAERMPGSTEVRDLGGLVGNLARMWAELAIVMAIALRVLAKHPRIPASGVGAAIACSGEQPGGALPCTRPQSRRV